MCTVTIVPKGKQDFILTSNRDEAPVRVSLLPNYYLVNGVNLLFPMDELSDGTWIGVSERQRVVCILNGGFVWHERKMNYKKSRGIVAKDFMVANDVVEMVKLYDFDGIEPFTMVIADWNISLQIFELVWDGENKHFKELPLEPKIWSSSTLYTEAMKDERLQWFEAFKTTNQLNANTMLGFHKTTEVLNKDYGVIMDRGYVKTTSITQVVKNNDEVHMYYENLQNSETNSKSLIFPQVINE